jgi:phosphomannomutase/phosphoglucomutase
MADGPDRRACARPGREVIDIGEVPTPMAYFASFHLRTGCCVSVTGSHNPARLQRLQDRRRRRDAGRATRSRTCTRASPRTACTSRDPGQISIATSSQDYIQRISGDIQIERKLKVVVDCGNGVAGAIAPELLAAIGAEVEPLLLRGRRHLPAPPSRPSDPGQPHRPGRVGAAHRRRHRPGLRRRRRTPRRGHQEAAR